MRLPNGERGERVLPLTMMVRSARGKARKQLEKCSLDKTEKLRKNSPSLSQILPLLDDRTMEKRRRRKEEKKKREKEERKMALLPILRTL